MAKNTGRDDLDDIDDEDDDDEELDDSQLVKKLRQEVKRLSKDGKDKTELQRELAMVKAGIDTESKLGKMFAKSFEGDITDIDAIKAEAVEIGLVKVESAEGEGKQEGSEAQGDQGGKDAQQQSGDQSTKERQALASGATPDDGSGVDPRKSGLDEATDRIAKGATYEEGASSMLGQLVGAAMSGDQRVVVKGHIESD